MLAIKSVKNYLMGWAKAQWVEEKLPTLSRHTASLVDDPFGIGMFDLHRRIIELSLRIIGQGMSEEQDTHGVYAFKYPLVDIYVREQIFEYAPLETSNLEFAQAKAKDVAYLVRLYRKQMEKDGILSSIAMSSHGLNLILRGMAICYFRAVRRIVVDFTYGRLAYNSSAWDYGSTSAQLDRISETVKRTDAGEGREIYYLQQANGRRIWLPKLSKKYRYGIGNSTWEITPWAEAIMREKKIPYQSVHARSRIR